MLRVLRFLFSGCTGSCCGEIEVCSFNALPMVSLLTGTSGSTLTLFSNRRRVHRGCPSGTGPQAISINLASARPSGLRFALSKLGLLFNLITESMPYSIYCLMMLETVEVHMPLDFAPCLFVYDFPHIKEYPASAAYCFGNPILTNLRF